jgi:hypothetical protein
MIIIKFISTALCLEEKEVKDFINSSPYRISLYTSFYSEKSIT